ncbi:hypothetical protein TNCV_1223791 [Trichonephila clavipes]|nr:hypothetical protein TNCV_1223791 [Trichonephila clavipes]
MNKAPIASTDDSGGIEEIGAILIEVSSTSQGKTRSYELLDDWNVDVPSWKYPRNLESPRVSSPGFGNDSKMMAM